VDEIGTHEPHCPGEEEGEMDFAGVGLTDEEERIFNTVFADIAEFFPPQKEALKAGILKGGNFVISSPTASGKTLLAELVMLKSVLNGGKCLYVVPLNALAYEKFSNFKRRSSSVRVSAKEGWEIKVGISTGDYESPSRYLANYDIIVLTLEKFDALTRVIPAWLRSISTVVVDEIHEVGDSKRGARLEGAIARFRIFNPKARIIALSATIPNAEEFGAWLSASVIRSDWRPVPLREGVLLARNDEEIVRRVLKEVAAGGQVLVFVNTKRGAAAFARKIAERMNVCEELEEVAERVDLGIDDLAEIVRRGVAYHNSWLHPEQRRAIEDAFRSRKLKVICCTPTLAMGVSLPAKVVIIRNYRFFSGFSAEKMPVFWVKQVFGRAGRPEHDDFGIGLIVARSEKEREEIEDLYLRGSPERIASSFSTGEMKEQILATIVSGAERKDAIEAFLKRTFFAVQHKEEIECLLQEIDEILWELEADGFVEIKRESVRATPFGKLASLLYLSVESAKVLRDGLRELSEFERFEERKISDFDILMLLCSCEEVPSLNVKSAISIALNLSENAEWVYRCSHALGTAIVSHAWIEEMSYAEMKKRFGAYPGEIYAAVSTLEWISYAASRIAHYLYKESEEEKSWASPHFKVFAERLLLLKDRIKHGVRTELLALTALRGVGRSLARKLYTAGFRSVAEVANADAKRLAEIPQIGEKRARKIKEAAEKFVRGADASE